jgi:HKD family nuclease
VQLILHSPGGDNPLWDYYERAFKDAVELYVVSAFLTDWNGSLRLNKNCRRFQLIIGSDFGITRKAACQDVMSWLPTNPRAEFLVADGLATTFHPKAIFWKEKSGSAFAVIGSSNLTRAALKSNYEVNAYSELSENDYAYARQWISAIAHKSAPVTPGWLKKYKESTYHSVFGKDGKIKRGNSPSVTALTLSLPLPKPRGFRQLVDRRRLHYGNYEPNREAILNSFRRCAKGGISKKDGISNDDFYQAILPLWSPSRMMGRGFEISGKHSNFQSLSRGFVRSVDAAPEDRDDVVQEEIDRLEKLFFRRCFACAFPTTIH